MKKTVQKAVVKIIKPAIIKYFCDGCGYEFKKGERKHTLYITTKSRNFHYCNKCVKELEEELIEK